MNERPCYIAKAGNLWYTYFRLKHTLLDLARGAKWFWIGLKEAEAELKEVNRWQ
jgi:hypothetical protein